MQEVGFERYLSGIGEGRGGLEDRRGRVTASYAFGSNITQGSFEGTVCLLARKKLFWGNVIPVVPQKSIRLFKVISKGIERRIRSP